MNASTSIAAISAALCKAQSLIEGAKKDNTNPHFKSRYADLASVWDACRVPLSKHGLAVMQLPGKDDRGYYLATILTHESGEWVEGILYIVPVKDDPQGLGSAITYARRYALAAMVGVAPDDDDAEGSMGRSPAKPEPRPPPQRPAPPAVKVPENAASADDIPF